MREEMDNCNKCYREHNGCSAIMHRNEWCNMMFILKQSSFTYKENSRGNEVEHRLKNIKKATDYAKCVEIKTRHVKHKRIQMELELCID